MRDATGWTNGARVYVRLSPTNPNNPYGLEVLVGYDMAAESALLGSQHLPLDSEFESTNVMLTIGGPHPVRGLALDVTMETHHLQGGERVAKHLRGESLERKLAELLPL